MNRDAFPNHELCDGGCCILRDGCARYMGNADIGNPRINHYVILNRKPWPGACPFFITPPHVDYPQKNENITLTP